MIAWLKKRPWLLIVVAFLVLFTAWFFFLKIAIQTQPESVPLETRTIQNGSH